MAPTKCVISNLSTISIALLLIYFAVGIKHGQTLNYSPFKTQIVILSSFLANLYLSLYLLVCFKPKLFNYKLTFNSENCNFISVGMKIESFHYYLAGCQFQFLLNLSGSNKQNIKLQKEILQIM